MVRGSRGDYYARHPGPHDVALVVEVADATLNRDRILKKRIYAEARIPWYWFFNLKTGKLETYYEPEAGVYKKSRTYDAGEAVPVELEGELTGEISVSKILSSPSLPRQAPPSKSPRSQKKAH